ncbi:hypothetical protein ACFYL6_19105 [Micromonospora sp. NPDC007208]|uniref:hypothetical protein n=1 Tax=Micromonospora sp. NPDC007208 TaxID=3364236 RepID=UPI0036C7F01D
MPWPSPTQRGLNRCSQISLRALSVIAGATYLPAALGAEPTLSTLILYTAAGGVFFVLQAATLAWRLRQRTVRV